MTELGPFSIVTIDISEPNSCTWCGISKQEHGWRWFDGVHWHRWIEPSDSLRLIRMLSRRRNK